MKYQNNMRSMRTSPCSADICLNKKKQKIHAQVTLWISIDPVNNKQLLHEWLLITRITMAEGWQVEADSIYQDLDNSEYHKTRTHCCEELNSHPLGSETYLHLTLKGDSIYCKDLWVSHYFFQPVSSSDNFLILAWLLSFIFSHFCLKIIQNFKCDRHD